MGFSEAKSHNGNAAGLESPSYLRTETSFEPRDADLSVLLEPTAD
jgi:hypothetical protein